MKRFFVLFLLVTFAMSSSTVLAQRGEKLPPIKHSEFKLKNGLRVIMHQDKSTPIVAVNVWYHVGSKNEVAGRTGFAHLFEHMMFQGSKNYDADYFTPLQEAGANINGSTSSDRTNYYEVLPSNFLELALFMEADRMGGLLEAMTLDKLNNQRDVVKNERRQRVDNQPYGTAGERIGEIMFPKGHPYNWSVIGSLDDLSAASLDDVKGFFRQYYVPNNASLVIAGDFDERQARSWVEKYFGGIAKGAEITRPNPAMPKLDKETRVSVEDSVPLPRVYMVWHGVPQGDKDEPALDILGSVLSSGRGSRLQSNLVYGKELAQTIGAGNGTREVGGTFQVTATARQGKSLEEIEKEINLEIERIKQTPPTAEEITRALNQIESGSILGLQTVLGKADSLNSNAVFFGKPDLFQKQLDEYRRVTPADLQRVANTYLTANRLVMSYVPRKGGAPGARAANAATNTPTSVSAADKKKTTPDSSKLPKAGPDPRFSLPPIEKAKLSNGLEIWMVRQTELPIVSMNMVFKSGGTFEPAEKSGVSSMTATLLDDGTKTRSALDIANGLQSIGAAMGAGSSWDSTSVSISTLTRNLDQALDIYSDVILNPIFPETEFESTRRRTLGGFLQRRSNPNAISDLVYDRVLYGKEHPYGRQLSGTETTIKNLTRNDLMNFYESTYRPNNAVLVVVGDVDAKTLMPKLEKSFANWKPGTVPTGKLAEAKPLDKAGIYLVDRSGAAQSVVSIGQIGVPRDSPDYFPLQVMNSILGGQFSARVNMNLREDKGYTYGARTGLSYRRGAGPFTASADVQTAVTKESVAEFIKEIKGIRGDIPVTQAELEYNKQSLIRAYPRGFETVGQISGQLSNLVVYGLPDSYFNEYISKVNAVTLADVNRVANKYLTPDKMAIVVVGDRSVIEPGLKQLEYPITILDTEGNPIQ
ncbi:MAG: putative Zn-dependent peptidase [Acidobacteria bacterium]|nr:putative Zn-dependent peptidase [Acidobacteriota bacterium]